MHDLRVERIAEELIGRQQQHEAGAEDDAGGEETVEKRRLAQAAVDGRFEAERLADDVRSRERQDGGREQSGVENAEPEEAGRELACERLEGASEIDCLRGVDIERRFVVDQRGVVDRRGVGDDHEPGDDDAENRADNDVGAHVPQIARPRALLDDRRLQKELHVGGDRRADQADDRHEKPGFRRERRDERAVNDGAPIGLRLDARHDVAQVDQRENHENALDDFVAQTQHEQKHDDGRERDDDVAREVEDLRPRRDAGEFRRRDAGVDEEQRGHRDERQADAEVLADQTGQALAGDRAHAAGHLLHHDQRNRERNERPQYNIAELCAGRGVGRDAADVVPGRGRDEARSEHGEEHQRAAPPAAEVHSYTRSKRSCRWCLVKRGSCFLSRSGMIASIASSTVTMPSIFPASSRTGHASRS